MIKCLTEYAQFVRNQIASRLPGSVRHPVTFKRQDDVFIISIQGKTVMAPGRRRWRCYRQGFEERLQEVAVRYGLDQVEPESEDDWVVDVGGYMGEWSLYMLNKGFNVLAIEPDPVAAKCLKHNLESHGRKDRKWLHDPRVTLNESKEVTFFSEPTNADGSVFPGGSGRAKEISVQAECLDNIIAERIGDRIIHAIKMDAEGAEPEVLAGAAHTLERCRRIGIDAGDERMGECTNEECSEILKGCGFRIITGEKPFEIMVLAEPDETHPLSRSS